jgi:hypothetical protein
MSVARPNRTGDEAAISNDPRGDRLAGPDAFLHCGVLQDDPRFRTQPNFRLRLTRLVSLVGWKRVVRCYRIARLNNGPGRG